jgi:hypothetical protein
MPSMRIDLDPEAVKIIPPGMTFIQAVRAGYAGRIESRAYLDWIKTMPCDTCGAPGPSDPSHVNAFKGQGTKSPDLFAIPECRENLRSKPRREHRHSRREHGEAMAKRYGDVVTCEFNEIPLDAIATSDPKEIAAGYMAEMQRRSDEYHASPEYAKQQQEAKEAHEHKMEQQAIALAAAPATLTLRDPEGWQKAVEVNKADPYSNAVIVFAEKWARIMEARMKQVPGLTVAECAEAACSLLPTTTASPGSCTAPQCQRSRRSGFTARSCAAGTTANT